jgi:hypothetical protein
MSVLRSIIAHFAVTADSSALDKLDTQLGKVKAGLGALAGALALNETVRWVNDVAAAVDDLGDTSDRLDISERSTRVGLCRAAVGLEC